MKKLGRVLLKVLKTIGIIILSFVMLLAAADALWMFIPQWKASAKIEDVANYAKTVEEISIRDGVEVIAIGEASHGNKEFQELKLEVLKQMVEKKGARSFALEVDFGDGIIVNDYIHGGQGTAKEAMEALSFSIYQTEEVLEMIEWMRSYNDSAKEEDQLSFYGFDMQVPDNSIELISNFCKENNIDAAKDIEADIETIYVNLTDKETELKNVKNYDLIVKAADCILQEKEYYTHQGMEMMNVRDKYMATNVEWILNYEKSLGNDVIVIGGHNGHVQKQGTFYKSMGNTLEEDLGDKYFVISTDYYHTTCNINVLGPDTTRANHKFVSADPLAKQAKYFYGSYYLNFDEVDEGSETYSYISNIMRMGSLGEGYSLTMSLVPSSTRVQMVPPRLQMQ